MHSFQVMHTTSRNDRGIVYATTPGKFLDTWVQTEIGNIEVCPHLNTFNLMKFTGDRICNRFHLGKEDREPKMKRNNHSEMINGNSLNCTVSLSNQKINKTLTLFLTLT